MQYSCFARVALSKLYQRLSSPKISSGFDAPDSLLFIVMSNNPILIISGEQSGETYAGLLVRELQRINPALKFYGTGGERVKEAGVELLHHINQMAVVGISEVVRKYRILRGIFTDVVSSIPSRSPQLAILVDYPGFNLKLAAVLKERGIPVVWFMAPQVWAWKESRVKQMRRVIDTLVVGFKFEVEYFQKHGIAANYFGHPLVDLLTTLESQKRAALPNSIPTIAYLPGSRKGEIARHWPLVREVAALLGERFRHVVQRAPSIPPDLLLGNGANIEILSQPHSALMQADVALVKSGTSTMEATIFGVPYALFYRTSAINFAIFSRLAKVRQLGIANIIAGKEIVREFLQTDATPQRLADEIRRLATDAGYRQQVAADLLQVRNSLEAPGVHARIAEHIASTYGLRPTTAR
ncbi:MAG: lipid-A-disaccharide synthase [Chlorobi bacterium CHB2]|nr:lipid-A-disaccharide synthase [Chlorobi bacterium CHB2]